MYFVVMRPRYRTWRYNSHPTDQHPYVWIPNEGHAPTSPRLIPLPEGVRLWAPNIIVRAKMTLHGLRVLIAIPDSESRGFDGTF